VAAEGGQAPNLLNIQGKLSMTDEKEDEAAFELWQDGMMVAGAVGPRTRAAREINHYALVYGQDGPVEIREVRP